jgi:hypothetical protein
VGMLNTISALSSAPGGKAVVSLASTITTYLMSVYKDDGTLSLSHTHTHIHKRTHTHKPSLPFL